MVVDRTRNPLSQASVSLIPDRERYWLPEDIAPMAQATADEKGQFTLSADVPDTMPLALLASAPGYRLARFTLDRKALGRKIGLTLEPGTSIRGTVRDEANRPLPGAQIGPLLPAAVDTERSVGEKIVPKWTRSAPDGTFAFENVMPDVNYHFLVRADGHELADISAPAGASDLGFRLQPGGSEISGQIIARGVPSSDFAGMKVRLNGNGFDVVETADESGRFTLRGIPSGDYSLEAMPADLRASRVALVTLPDAHGSTWPLEIASAYSVSGTVVDVETSTPAAGVALRIKDAEERPGIEVRSGTDGTFVAGPFLQAAVPQIEVLPESGYVSTWQLGEEPVDLLGTDGFTDVTGARVPVRLKRIIAVEFPNFNQTTQPIALTLLGPEGEKSKVQRATATSATLEIPVYAGGRYRLWGVSGALATDLATLEISDQSRIPAPLTFGPVSRIAGRLAVRASDGSTTLPAGYTVRVTLPTDTPTTETAESLPLGHPTTDRVQAARTIAEISKLAPDGSFSFSNLPAGEFQVEAQNRTGTRKASKTVQLTPGAVETADFNFDAGKSLSGQLVTTDNRPVPAAVVRVRLRGGTAGAGRELVLAADENGRFRAEDLEADVADTLYIDFHGFLPARVGPFTLPADNITVVLTKRGLLRVKVEDAPASQWEVYLMAAEPWRRGTHPEQLMSRAAEAPIKLAGGEEGEIKVPGAGRYRLIAVTDAGGLAVSDPFAWEAGDETDRQMILTPGATGGLTGTYEGTASAEVTAWNTSLPERPGLTAEFQAQAENGRFSFSALPPGDYLVIAAGDGVYASAANVQVSAGGSANVTLESDSGGAPVRGVIRIGDKAVPGADLELVSQTDETAPIRRTRSSNTGTFTFEAAPADEYLVRATFKSEQGEVTGQRAVTVPRRGDPPAVDLDIQPPRTATVAAAEAAKLGLTSGVDVFFMNQTSRDLIKGTWTPEGEIQAQLPPGQYDVWRGDETVGNATVTPEGAVRLAPLAPPE